MPIVCLHLKIVPPSIHPRHFPNGHRFVQDNDPKHCSKLAWKFYEDKGINWWPTPPESPDLNPIENKWHELKEYIRREVKPTSKAALIQGILGNSDCGQVSNVHRPFEEGHPRSDSVRGSCNRILTGYFYS